MADGLPVESGSEAHLLMHQMSQEALRITAEINCKYHEPAELRKLLAELRAPLWLEYRLRLSKIFSYDTRT